MLEILSRPRLSRAGWQLHATAKIVKPTEESDSEPLIGREGGGARGGRRTPQSNEAIGDAASGSDRERSAADGRDVEPRDASRNSFSMPSDNDLGSSSGGR